MRLLLDTHVFVWLLGEPSMVGDDARALLADRRNEVLVSAVSAMEVSTKVRLGNFESAGRLVESWSARVADIQASELAITTEHALLAGSLDWAHRDPFDRLLAAQSIIENLTLVSTDPAMTGLGGLRVLRW